MPATGVGPGDGLHVIDEWAGGIGWIAAPNETMQRASHALVVGDDVWVVDPVDASGLDDLLARYGTVAGVAVLFNWHARDAGSVASRHGVAVHLPSWVNRVERRIESRVERFDVELGNTGFCARRIAPHPLWREAVLYRETDRTLVVPDSIGTVPYFRTPVERLGVSPYQRLWPPRQVLGDLVPDRILVGHGIGVFDDAADALADALAGARRQAPMVIRRHGRTLVRNLATAIRS